MEANVSFSELLLIGVLCWLPEDAAWRDLLCLVCFFIHQTFRTTRLLTEGLLSY
jgi:hypothetical protein